ncbi:MAG TPA: DUF1153 domain-containing protein [Rhizomicrobium sp.]|jgi:hypothetical protein|nr:DUF1153 domain-containing protein [Rhizomicrobium sp.]
MGRLASGGDAQIRFIYGPAGETLTLPKLPPTDTRRWISRRKAEVVAAVQNGLLTLSEACQRYSLSVEEFTSWQLSIERHGLAGLRTTHLHRYRRTGHHSLAH